MRIRALSIAITASLIFATSAVAAVPTTTTGNVTSITQTSVKLHGTVKPNNQDTTWHFEVGTTNAYGTNTAESGPVVAGAGNTAVAADVAGLAPGTVYHFRLVATNGSGAIPGKDRTFTTRSAVSLNAAKTTAAFNESVPLTGQVFGTAVAGITVTLAENPYPFAGFTDVSTTTTDATGHFQFIRVLRANTAWRVVAGTKPAGTSNTAFTLESDLLGLKACTSRPKKRHSVLFTGFSLPARVGSPVHIQRLGRTGWHTVLTATLSATPVPDTASYAVRLKKVVSGAYRAYVPAGYDHVAAASSTKHIKVRR
jgi:hypothetical protein